MSEILCANSHKFNELVLTNIHSIVEVTLIYGLMYGCLILNYTGYELVAE